MLSSHIAEGCSTEMAGRNEERMLFRNSRPDKLLTLAVCGSPLQGLMLLNSWEVALKARIPKVIPDDSLGSGGLEKNKS